MKDKIREIVKEELKRYKICEDKELSSTFASLIAHKIIEITRLDEKKVRTCIHTTREWQALHLEVQANILNGVKKGISKAICSQQDELTKEWGYENT